MIRHVRDTESKDIGSKGQKRMFAIAYCSTCDFEFETQKYRIKNMTNCSKCRSLKHGMGKHGKNRHKLYRVWDKIKQRCYNKNHDSYKDYGARGILMHNEWINDFCIFRDWFIENGWNENLETDRRDNNDGYFPHNIRFVTSDINSQNTRVLRRNNTSGYRCVFKSGNNWVSKITVRLKQISLGSFKTKEEAANAYDNYVVSNKLEHNINFPEKFDGYKAEIRDLDAERKILEKI